MFFNPVAVKLLEYKPNEKWAVYSDHIVSTTYRTILLDHNDVLSQWLSQLHKWAYWRKCPRPSAIAFTLELTKG